MFMISSLLLAASTPTRGQDEPREGAEQDIVVTGNRMTSEQAEDYVRSVGVARGQRPAARWLEAVCPKVHGIAEPYAQVVEAKMRDIARETGIRAGGKRCKPNIAVSFVGDGAALVNGMYQRSASQFREVPPDAREALFKGNAPVRWWYSTGVRSRHGTGEVPVTIPLDGFSPALPSAGLSQYGSSIVSTQVVRAIVSANVVIDFDDANGFDLEAVAAYAAFVAFAEVRAGDAPPDGSILGMFSAQRQVRDMAEQDKTFLRALYSLPLDRNANQHRARLVKEMLDPSPGG